MYLSLSRSETIVTKQELQEHLDPNGHTYGSYQQTNDHFFAKHSHFLHFLAKSARRYKYRHSLILAQINFTMAHRINDRRFDNTRPAVGARFRTGPMSEAARVALRGGDLLKFYESAVKPMENKFTLKHNLTGDITEDAKFFENQLNFTILSQKLRYHIESKCMQSVFNIVLLDEFGMAEFTD